MAGGTGQFKRRVFKREGWEAFPEGCPILTARVPGGEQVAQGGPGDGACVTSACGEVEPQVREAQSHGAQKGPGMGGAEGGGVPAWVPDRGWPVGGASVPGKDPAIGTLASLESALTTG